MQVVAGKGNLDEDSYQKVEEPVRDTAPDQGCEFGHPDMHAY